ncbi:MAG TPA: hypothetical protein VF623_10890 [Segetibacter sp.]|jgi:hypothetical protein
MKKLFIIALLALSIGSSAFANTTAAISKTVINRFYAEYKDASNVSWSTTGNYAKASFTVDNKKMEAYYNTNGEVVATSTNISLDELPVNAKRTFAKKFAGYTVKEAIRFEGAEESGYYISAENDKLSIILKVNENNQVGIFKTTKK